jgi:hypothetical protein
LYSHLRFVIAVALIAFGSVIAVGVPVLFVSVDRPLITAEMADPPADSSCTQQSWRLFDRNCLSRRGLPWVVARAGSDPGTIEVPSEPDSKAAEQSSTDSRQAATIPQEPTPLPSVPQPSVHQDSEPQLFVPRVSVPQSFTRRDSVPRDVTPQEPTPQDSARNDTASEKSAVQNVAPQELTPQEAASQESPADPPVQQREVAAPVRATPAQRPAAEERHAAQPTTGAQPRMPIAKRTARRDRTTKPPANEALNAVRKFGDTLPEIPANSYAADGTPRKIVIRPTSIQDVYYYSRGSTSP